jgi:hypothetical protein
MHCTVKVLSVRLATTASVQHVEAALGNMAAAHAAAAVKV